MQASSGSNSNLTNVTVLVTRPQHQAAPFCQMVEAAGGRAIRFPVIVIEAIPLADEQQQALQSPADKLIFISANAVRLGLPLLQQTAPQLLAQSQIIAIGQATASQLGEMGHAPQLIPPSPYNSEALLAIAEMQDCNDQHVVIIKGRGGRGYLKEQLLQRGANVIEIETYVRNKPAGNIAMLERFIGSEQAVVSITSVKGLHYLFEMANAEQAGWLRRQAHFLVPGTRVADAVKDLHVTHAPRIAENACDEVMFNALCAAYGSSQAG